MEQPLFHTPLFHRGCVGLPLLVVFNECIAFFATHPLWNRGCGTGVAEQGFFAEFFAALKTCFNTVVFPVGRSCGTGGVEQGVCSKKTNIWSHICLYEFYHHHNFGIIIIIIMMSSSSSSPPPFHYNHHHHHYHHHPRRRRRHHRRIMFVTFPSQQKLLHPR